MVPVDNDRTKPAKSGRFEWATFSLILLCYLVWGGIGWFYSSLGDWGGWIIFPALAILSAFHTSLQHEALHGHPSRSAMLNEAMVFCSLSIVFPFRRYRRLHLQHHRDEMLTDPFEDPESWFWSPQDVVRMRPLVRALLAFNNTFFGRMLIGPALSLIGFSRTEIKRLQENESGVRLAWLLHLVGLVPIIAWLAWCQIPLWQYLLFAVYPALSLIGMRSFAEHQAAESVGARTAIVEANPLFALLYLNNNLHMVHHAHPSVAWYDLPGLYRERREQYLAANEGYLFNGYWDVAKRYFARMKQDVPHPLMAPVPVKSEAPQERSSRKQ